MDSSGQPNQHNATRGKDTLISDHDIQEKGVENGFHRVGADDVAATFLHGLDASVTSAPVTDAESKKLLTKIDWALIPLLSGTVILAAVDKVIISNAAIYGMTADTHLVGQQYSWVGSIFYFGYLIAEFPAAYLVQRLPVAKLLVGCVTAWGVLMMCIAATQNFAGLATIRFLFGMAEVPAFIIASIITTMWWTTAEQPIRIAFWFNQARDHRAQPHTAVANHLTGFIDLRGYHQLWNRSHEHIYRSMALAVLGLGWLFLHLGSRAMVFPARFSSIVEVPIRPREIRLHPPDPTEQHWSGRQTCQVVPGPRMFVRCQDLAACPFRTGTEHSERRPCHFLVPHCVWSWLQQARNDLTWHTHRSHRDRLATDLVFHPSRISTSPLCDDCRHKHSPADLCSPDVAAPTIKQARFASCILLFLLILGYAFATQRWKTI